jgi:SAM-dependent methyltransferase
VSERFRFEVVDATDYDELRPGYTGEAVAWVVDAGSMGRGSLVIDLAAGTGQLSRLLVTHDLQVVAVEPASNMRAVFAERQPSIRVVDGTAEALPFDDGVVDAVVVGNAFHHFDREAALIEAHRVLRPAGTLALFWAWPLEDEQRRTPEIDAIYDVVERARTNLAITAAYRSWADPPVTADGFGPFERREFRMTYAVPSARLVDLYATSSDIASMPAGERDELLRRIAELARSLPELLELPGRTVVDRCVRA